LEGKVVKTPGTVSNAAINCCCRSILLLDTESNDGVGDVVNDIMIFSKKKDRKSEFQPSSGQKAAGFVPWNLYIRSVSIPAQFYFLNKLSFGWVLLKSLQEKLLVSIKSIKFYKIIEVI